MKSLTCINSKILVDSVFTHLDFRGNVFGCIPPLICYGPSYQLVVVRKLTFICSNQLLKVCSLNRNVCMGFEARFLI